MLKEGYTLPFQTKLDQVTHNCQLLYTSPKESLPVRGIASADKQKCNRVGQKLGSLVFYNRLFLVPKHNIYSRSEQFQQIPQAGKI